MCSPLVVDDGNLLAVSLGNMACCAAVVALTTWRRRARAAVPAADPGRLPGARAA